ncbi:MAG TPA: GNAT family N-acetyltransferase [Lachnospiraceae bacterium]|nr:GNAT family N-acetyltransferase [Lachnospiraceae bacterium]
MEYVMRNYTPDKERTLCAFYERMNKDCDCNFTRVVWEWLRNAPCFELFRIDKIGMWYEDNEVSSTICLNSTRLGSAVVDTRSSNKDLLQDIIRYAEATFMGIEEGKRFLYVHVNEFTNLLKQELKDAGYEQLEDQKGALYFPLREKILPKIVLPEGFEVKPLSEVYDFDRLSRILWEGFNYDGAVPKYNDEVYLPFKHAWLNYNRDICSVVVAPDGSYASFCGFWYTKETQSGYLEPMVTAKEYRNLGLGKTCVYHSLNTLQALGCRKVFVEPDEDAYDYYCRLGFETQNYSYSFKKNFD